MEYDKKVMNRLKRIEGQIKGVLGMMEQGEGCREIVTQLTGARNGMTDNGGNSKYEFRSICRENIMKGEETNIL